MKKIKNPSDLVSYRKSFAWVTTLLITVGLVTLYGWQYDISVLRSFVPQLRLINPLGSVGLILLAISMLGYSVRKSYVTRVPLLLLSTIGVLVLLQVPIDSIIFGSKVAAQDNSGLAYSAACSFILLSFVILTYDSKKRLIAYACFAAALTVISISLLNVYALLYFSDYAYRVAPGLIMALPLSVALGILGATLLLNRQNAIKQDIMPRGLVAWVIIVIVVCIQILTYLFSDLYIKAQQVKQDSLDTDTGIMLVSNIEKSIEAHVDLLRDYRSFYISSGNVTQAEFQRFYDSNVKQHSNKNVSSSIRAMTYIRAVPDGELNRFVRDQRFGEDGLGIRFTPSEVSNEQTHYIVLYHSDGPSSAVVGRDLSSSPERLAVFLKAVEQQVPIASDSIQFKGPDNVPYKGFFISQPVRNFKDNKTTGFINVLYDYDVLFETLKQNAIDSRVLVTVLDRSGNVIYKSQKNFPETKCDQTLAVKPINIDWNICITKLGDQPVSLLDKNLPYIVVSSGMLISIILIIMILFINRSNLSSRQFALKIADERNRLLTSFDSASAGILVTDIQGKTLYSNEKGANLLMTAEKIGAQYSSSSISAAALRNKLHVYKKTIHTDSQSLKIDARAVSSSNGITGCTIIIDDITKQILENRSRDEFFAIASHELRTPLTTIRGNSSILLSYWDQLSNEEHVSMQNDIYDSSVRLIALVNSFLEVSRLEHGKLVIELEEISLKDLIDIVIKDLASLASEKKITLKFRGDIDSYKPVIADRNRLLQVLDNLVSNAIKYSDEGTVTIDVVELDGHTKISVYDNGVGILPKDRIHLFQKFQQASDNALARDSSRSTGLGLYTSQLLMKAMGGKIVYMPNENSKGSIFTATLRNSERTTVEKLK